MPVTNIPYDALTPGQTVRIQKTIEDRDILLFAALSGDRNPVHLDDSYAARSLFKGRVAHGMLAGALISAAIACELPGPGSIYMGQKLAFLRPVRPGDTLTIELEVLEKLPKMQVRLATRVFNQNGEQVVDGEAEVVAPRRQQEVSLTGLPEIRIGH